MAKRKNKKVMNVDSTPEFICEECGYHADSCVCKGQKVFVPIKLTDKMIYTGKRVAEISLNNSPT